MVALPAHLLVSTDLSPEVRAQHQRDISQSEESMAVVWPIRDKRPEFNIFLWQSQICSHECLHRDSREPTLGNEWGVCSQWGKGLGYLFWRVRDVPISRARVSPDPCCDVNIYREWHKTSWSVSQPIRGQEIVTLTNERPSEWVTVTGTGHCPPVTCLRPRLR